MAQSAPSELAWKLADYQRAGHEPPTRLERDPEACEGQLMTAAEVASHLADSIATLMILIDGRSPRVETVRQHFRADLDFLLGLGKIDSDEYNEIVDSEEMQS